MNTPIYLDNQATTPLDPRVLEAMMPYLQSRFGNAASRSHCFGWEAEKAVDLARRQVASLIGCAPREIVFTSGATESNNLALKGAMEANSLRGRHIVTVATEHKAILDTVRHLCRQGCEASVLVPDSDGLVSPEQIKAALRNDTMIVSVMFANNEIGVVQPIRAIGAMCRDRGVLFHCDAAQGIGKLPINVSDDFVDLLSLSGHKMYGPKGVGALFVRRSKPKIGIEAQMDGGGHEFGLRSGTLNVPAVVGLGAAAEFCEKEMKAECRRTLRLRERLRSKLEAALPTIQMNGSLEKRLPGNLNVSIGGVDAEALLMSIPDIALSTGSACTSASVEPSHVLLALGFGPERARCTIRLGIGRFNSAEEIDYAAERVIDAARRLRDLGSSSTQTQLAQ